ncbi:Uncharacterised protein [Mycolicibacterium fortuitum]|uniref:HK97 gp10 family phage protein n=1 Tax=Mycolicibacterium fortuitum TaxID=1766 RepID=A0A378V114_MYCFO|nr:Uncharacterised protein [Mycolicibacterium fortuitum]
MARLYSEKVMNRIVAQLPGVHDELGDTARRVRHSATRRLETHFHSGDARVTLTEGDVDWFVNLDDKAAMSIEFGHWVKGKYESPGHPKYVQGLYILSKAAGIA